MESKDLKAMTAANRQAWNASAVHHASGPAWEALVEGFSRPGFSVLDATLSACLQAVGIQGKSVVQVGCNNGRELLSTFSLGSSSGLGIDQSEAFIEQAERLNARAGAPCRFLCSDIFDLPSDAPNGFDIALITIGVLNWMPDLRRFFAVVADLMTDGGRLVIYETHPFLEMFDPASSAPFQPTCSYFRRAPIVETAALVYDGSRPGPVTESYWFVHRLGDVLNACIEAGLQIRRLEEYPHSIREVDYDIYAGQSTQLPMCFTLIATKSV